MYFLTGANVSCLAVVKLKSGCICKNQVEFCREWKQNLCKVLKTGNEGLGNKVCKEIWRRKRFRTRC